MRPQARGVHGTPPLVVPREIVWLNGAPGSGKGTNSAFIMQARGFIKAPIEMSNLLKSDPAAQKKIAQGLLLDDEAVLDSLLDALFHPSGSASGAGSALTSATTLTPRTGSPTFSARTSGVGGGAGAGALI